MKSAFSNIIETVFPSKEIATSHQKVDEITKLLLDNLVEKDNFIDRKKLSEENTEILTSTDSHVEINSSKRSLFNTQNKISDFFPNKVTREKAIEFAVQVDDISDESSNESDAELDSTLKDVDEDFQDELVEAQENSIVNSELAYLPCAAHNLKLVLKDSFSECKHLLDKLLNKCTKFVTKCRN
jgi:hypothetical protein